MVGQFASYNGLGRRLRRLSFVARRGAPFHVLVRRIALTTATEGNNVASSDLRHNVTV